MNNGRSTFRMDDYVPVNDRIDAFKRWFPDGSLQSEITHLSESLVVVKAYAYRTPDDQRPGIGHSSVQIPGSTPYTRGSEIENAETSAWGRALAALGFEVKRGIASREEVGNKREPEPMQPRTPPAASVIDGDGEILTVGQLLGKALAVHGLRRQRVLEILDVAQPGDITDLAAAWKRIEEATAQPV